MHPLPCSTTTLLLCVLYTHTHTHTHTSTYVQVVCDPQRGSLEESRLTGNPRMHERVGSSSSHCKHLLPMKFSPLRIYSLFNLFHILFQLIWFYPFPPFSLHCIIEKAREFQKDIYFCFIDSSKAFDCVDHNKIWKILQEMGIADHLTCFLKNLYAGQGEMKPVSPKGYQP